MIPELPKAARDRLLAFESRLGALNADAWTRIAERCQALDERSFDGFLSRAALLARSVIPEASPYTQAPIAPILAVVGTAFGTVSELTSLLSNEPDELARRAARLRAEKPNDQRALAEAASLAILSRAARERPQHAGLAAALQAVAMMLSSPWPSAHIPAVYEPFEPEIPFASLEPPGEHAA